MGVYETLPSGNYHFSDGRSGHFEFSGKGFAIDRETVLTWSKAEKRLRELIIPFQEVDVALAVLLLLELAVDAVLAVLEDRAG